MCIIIPDKLKKKTCDLFCFVFIQIMPQDFRKYCAPGSFPLVFFFLSFYLFFPPCILNMISYFQMCANDQGHERAKENIKTRCQMSTAWSPREGSLNLGLSTSDLGAGVGQVVRGSSNLSLALDCIGKHEPKSDPISSLPPRFLPSSSCPGFPLTMNELLPGIMSQINPFLP